MHCGVMVTGYNQGDWSRLMAQRIGDRDALKGRHVLKDFLHAHGFGLK